MWFIKKKKGSEEGKNIHCASIFPYDGKIGGKACGLGSNYRCPSSRGEKSSMGDEKNQGQQGGGQMFTEAGVRE